MQLNGKVALITGGSRGIGKATAKLFHEQGAKVIITSKNLENLKKTQKEIDGIFSIAADISEPLQVEKVVNTVIEKYGRIDVLVNCAGILPSNKPLHEISYDEWNNIINVNLNGTFYFVKNVVRSMMSSGGGTIITMSSDAGLKPFLNFNVDAYAASKSALIFLTKTWALEYAKYQIRFNCICSAVVETDMTHDNWLSSKENIEKAKQAHPLGKIGTPLDVANAMLYFASDDSSWTTGAVLVVDGGVSVT